MAWSRIDDGLHAHRKAEAAGFEAMGLWVLALSWCAQQLTDGFVPRHIARRLVGGSGPKLEAMAGRLVAAGLWSPLSDYPAEYSAGTPASTPPSTSGGNPPPCVGWVFHDFLEYNRPRYLVLAEREAKSAAAKNTNSRRWGARTASSLERPPDPVAPAIRQASLQRPPDPDPDPIPKPGALSRPAHVRARAHARAETRDDFQSIGGEGEKSAEPEAKRTPAAVAASAIVASLPNGTRAIAPNVSELEQPFPSPARALLPCSDQATRPIAPRAAQAPDPQAPDPQAARTNAEEYARLIADLEADPDGRSARKPTSDGEKVIGFKREAERPEEQPRSAAPAATVSLGAYEKAQRMRARAQPQGQAEPRRECARHHYAAGACIHCRAPEPSPTPPEEP